MKMLPSFWCDEGSIFKLTNYKEKEEMIKSLNHQMEYFDSEGS
ncbi:hypothetical protein AAULR_26326 [Lacticaseibacillus rhamnosus MTCC 5462]|uniref:Uncharacterized protein n=1 Tax=Lacticaseibacillus rhamnosus LRHMDP3 TaxID=1203259 RepID=A0AB33XVC7_LACRH|nr:hypothetical protein AAULR_26326 [Lacticaseibacillus rhamnosus MTCC 5462]EKS51458.1 hypothetical protein LRHMDP3_1183 [Lacticaseibacillus rhamnosus LRHMDP3]EKS52074.1 hypothetical protein LRHMDP2_1241 [Lacticaseibacillus rhamnosus LRHMDP2]